MEIFWILVFAVWVLSSLGVAKLAGDKGRSSSAFFWIAFLISPILGFIIAASLSPIQQAERTPQLEVNRADSRLGTFNGDAMAKCPYCAEFVKIEATVCRYCHRDISQAMAKHLDAQKLAQEKVLAEERQRVLEAEERAKRGVEEHHLELQKKAALVAQRKAYFRSKKFVTLILSLAVGVIAVSGIIYSLTSAAEAQSARQWAVAKPQWESILQKCGLSITLLQNRKLNLTGANGVVFDTVQQQGPDSESQYWTPQMCAYYGITGTTSGDARFGTVDEGGVTWAPGWDETSVKRFTVGTAPIVQNSMETLASCPGTVSASTIAGTSTIFGPWGFFAEYETPSGISQNSPYGNWLSTKSKCVLQRYASTSQIQTLLAKMNTWYPQYAAQETKYFDSTSTANTCEAWLAKNPEPYLPLRLNGRDLGLYFEPSTDDNNNLAVDVAVSDKSYWGFSQC